MGATCSFRRAAGRISQKVKIKSTNWKTSLRAWKKQTQPGSKWTNNCYKDLWASLCVFEVHAASLNGVVNCWRLGFSVGFQKYNRQSEGSCDIPWGSVVIHVGKIVSTIPKSWDDLIAGVLGMHSYWSLCAVPAAMQALQGHAAPSGELVFPGATINPDLATSWLCSHRD